MIPDELFSMTLRTLFAPIVPYLDDPSVSEIMINGPNSIFIERKGQLERAPVKFDSPAAVLAALRNVAQFAGSFIDELILRAGGRNLAHDAPDPWPFYSVETVIARDPDVILLTNRYRDQVLARPAWQGIAAIRTGRVYEVDPDLVTVTGPRLVDGLEMLADLFHPEASR